MSKIPYDLIVDLSISSSENSKSFFSFESPKTKLEKSVKRFNDLLKELLSKDTIYSDQTRKKKLEKLASSLESIYKYFFNKSTFTNEMFESMMKSNFILTLASYFEFKSIDVSDIIQSILIKAMFESNELLQLIDLDETSILANKQSIYACKILLDNFTDIVKENSNSESIERYIVDFVDKLFNRFILYPNFYYAISINRNSEENNNKNFDSNLFELVIRLLSAEHLFQKRENKTIVRKCLIQCLNLEHFYLVNSSLLVKLLEILVDNLISYYQNFILFEQNMSKKTFTIKNIIADSNDLIKLNIDDTISYLKFFSIITHCFASKELKNYLCNLLFNSFFIEFIQNDILSLCNEVKYNPKISKILEFIYYFTSYVNNYELNEMLFYFLFGFDFYAENKTFGEDSFSDDENKINSQPSSSNKIINQKLFEDKDAISVSKKDIVNNENINNDNDNEKDKYLFYNIKNDVNKYFNSNSNVKAFSSSVKLNIEKEAHQYETILSFFQMTLESSISKNKSLLLNLFSNLATNIPYVFMSEIVVPYYLNCVYNYLYKTKKILNYAKVIEDLKKPNAVELTKILRTIHPKNFCINGVNWPKYFSNSMTKNYKINFNMLNRIENSNNIVNFLEDSFSYSRNFVAITESDDYCSNITMTNASMTLRELSNSKEEDSISYSFSDNKELLADKTNFAYMIKNYTISCRVKFFEKLMKNIKNYAENKYIDNLYYTKFLNIIGSFPYPVAKDENACNLYNIYSNVSFIWIKKKELFNISLVGIIHKIKNDLDKQINLKYTRDYINRVTIKNIDGGQDEKTSREGSDLIRNIVLYNEFYKEFLANFFSKAYLDGVNYGWSKEVIKDDGGKNN